MVAVECDPERQVERAALHAAALADLQNHAVEEHDRVDVLQRPLGPVAHIVHHGIRDPGDEVAADLHAVDLSQVRFDVSGRKATAIDREDLLVKANEPPLALADDLRLEAAIPIPWSVNHDL